MVVSGFVAVAYKALNKTPPPKQALVSDDIAQQLIDQQADMDTGPTYSNVTNMHIGYDPITIIQTNTLNGWSDCLSLCNGTTKCAGFQMRPDGKTCDLLNSNASSTLGFTDQDWTYFQLVKYQPSKLFDAPIANQTGGGARVGTTVSSATSKEECARYCKSNTECTAMTVGPSGCDLWKTGYSQYPSNGSNLYKLKMAQPHTVVVK